jgi:hypothetical protein
MNKNNELSARTYRILHKDVCSENICKERKFEDFHQRMIMPERRFCEGYQSSSLDSRSAGPAAGLHMGNARLNLGSDSQDIRTLIFREYTCNWLLAISPNMIHA